MRRQKSYLGCYLQHCHEFFLKFTFFDFITFRKNPDVTAGLLLSRSMRMLVAVGLLQYDVQCLQVCLKAFGAARVSVVSLAKNRSALYLRLQFHG